MNWFEAEDFCRSVGGHLASFQSTNGSAVVALGQQLNSRNGNFWIGLNILDSNSGYQWSDGQIIDFLNWDDNQPDNFQNNEQCVEMRPLNQRWNDISCYVERNWVCKIAKGIP